MKTLQQLQMKKETIVNQKKLLERWKVKKQHREKQTDKRW